MIKDNLVVETKVSLSINGKQFELTYQEAKMVIEALRRFVGESKES